MKKHIVIPVVLLIYLAVMSYIGYPSYVSGIFSPLYYFGVIGISLGVIVLLYFFIKKREQLRQERKDDIENADRSNREEKSDKEED